MLFKIDLTRVILPANFGTARNGMKKTTLGLVFVSCLGDWAVLAESIKINCTIKRKLEKRINYAYIIIF